jgi:hypothetical protein
MASAAAALVSHAVERMPGIIQDYARDAPADALRADAAIRHTLCDGSRPRAIPRR